MSSIVVIRGSNRAEFSARAPTEIKKPCPNPDQARLKCENSAPTYSRFARDPKNFGIFGVRVGFSRGPLLVIELFFPCRFYEIFKKWLKTQNYCRLEDVQPKHFTLSRNAWSETRKACFQKYLFSLLYLCLKHTKELFWRD